MTMAEARKKLPELAGLDDDQFIDAVHQLYYPTIDKAVLARHLGYTLPAAGKQSALPTQPRESPLPKAASTPESSSNSDAVDVVGTATFWTLLLGGLVGYFALRAEKKNDIASAGQDSNGLVGFNGWLRFLVISLGILGPALSLGNVAAGFYLLENASPPLALPQAWSTYKTVTWLTLGLFSAFAVYAALQLRFTWKPTSVAIAKAAVAAWPIGGVFIGIVIPQVILRDAALAPAANGTGQMIVSIVLSTMWFVYLSKSKRVSATYFGHRADEQAIRILPLAPEEPSERHSAPIEASVELNALSHARVADEAAEENMYDAVGAELESGILHKATWLKAFAQASGDENFAKATYINLRIEKLRAEKTIEEST